MENEKPKPRNYSFLHKKPDTLDEVESGRETFKIPAAAGSCYWAILKVCYENHDKPIHLDVLCKLVAELMEDRDERRWKIYTSKTKTTVHKRVKGELVSEIKGIKTWQERVIGNAKSLKRVGGNNAYGLRLRERGHVLRLDYDAEGKPYFILRTSDAPNSRAIDPEGGCDRASSE
jgi:hypothetical protein